TIYLRVRRDVQFKPDRDAHDSAIPNRDAHDSVTPSWAAAPDVGCSPRAGAFGTLLNPGMLQISRRYGFRSLSRYRRRRGRSRMPGRTARRSRIAPATA